MGKKNDKFTVPFSSDISPNTDGLKKYVEDGFTNFKNDKGEIFLREYTLNQDVNSINLFYGTELKNITAKTEGEARVGLRQKDFELVSFPVQVISGKVSSLNSGVDRKIATFTIDFREKVKNFGTVDISNNNKKTPHASNTVKTSDLFDKNFGKPSSSTSTSTSTLPKITNSCPTGMTNIAGLDKIKHNTNPNVYSCKGGITLEKIKMSGVKTLIVEGNITFNDNVTYDNNNASWAFIAKLKEGDINSGKITVNNKVTNLAGVFLAKN